MDILTRLEETARAVRAKTPIVPKVGAVLGSGLGGLVDAVKDATPLPYKDLPHFPVSRVAGHAGRLVLGTLEGVPVALCQGRVHHYEGWSQEDLAYNVRVLWKLGAKTVILTNAAGATNPSFRPGDLMLMTDHINLLAGSPLRGENVEAMGPRFPDMSRVYDAGLRETALKLAREMKVNVVSGIYAAVLGPQYETPAEVRMLRMLGADAIGMSTVPEAIAAAHVGMKVLGVSCITNLAAGITDQPLSHDEVLETGRRVTQSFIALLRRVIPTMG